MRLLRVTMVAAIAAACATNPATGKRQLMLMSEGQEVQLGRQSDVEVRQEMGLYNDAELQRYVAGIGQRLAQRAHRPGLPWSYVVVDASAINAFALPGGFMYITRGILPFIRDEAELAAVLGHETGHVDARHSAQAYSTQTLLGGGLALGSILFPKVGAVQGAASAALGLAFLKNSRDHELEADRLGVSFASGAGWAPEGMPGLLSTLGRIDEASGSSRGVPNWALTHPPAADRVAKVQEAVSAAKPGGGTATNRAEFERRLEGLVVGDSREQGMVRDGEFVHPIMRFAVRFPAGWPIANGAQAVTAQRDEQSSVAMVLQLAEGGANAGDTARDNMSKSGFTLVDGGDRPVNGLPAHVGTYQGQIENTPVRLRAAFIRYGQSPTQYFILAGLAPAEQFAGASSAFDSAISTFRPLSQAEADRIQPNRLSFYTVRAGETWESIARTVSGGRVSPANLAIMNGVTPATAPRTGDRVRVVIGG